MSNRDRDIACIYSALLDAGLTQHRADEIVADYRAARDDAALDAPVAEAAAHAQQELAANLAQAATERLRRAAKTAQLIAEYSNRVERQIAAPVKTSRLIGDRRARTPGVAAARAAVSLIEGDPRFPGVSYATHREVVRGRLLSRLGDALEIRKGAWERQVGAANLINVVRELSGEETRDQIARNFAAGLRKAMDEGVDLFNKAGGSMAKRTDYHLPQKQNAVKLIKAGKERWIADHMTMLDWVKMRWPNGQRIRPEQRYDALNIAYQTLSTNGASKIVTVPRVSGRVDIKK